MIFNEKKSLDFYRNLGVGGRYAKVVDFLWSMNLNALEPGKYEIDSKNMYTNVIAYTTIPRDETRYETHEYYTNIQCAIEGSGITTYVSVHETIVKIPYNSGKDVVFFENTVPGLRVVTKADQYLIFQPWDAHKSKVADQGLAPIKKAIVKIKED